MDKPGHREIRTVPVTSGPAVTVTSGPAYDWNPIWSPDGRFLYFSSDRGGSFNLWRVRIDERSGQVSGPLEQVTTPSQFVAHPSFAADGRHFVYTSIDMTENIQTAPFDPASGRLQGEPTWVTRGPQLWTASDLSPDGKQAAFGQNRETNDVFVINTDGTGRRQLTNDIGAHNWNPRWSPDGTLIAFQSDRTGSSQIWTIRPDGSLLRQLTEHVGSVLSFPTWSPDGKRIAANADEGVLIFDPNTPWTDQMPELIRGPFRVLAWSPDGKMLAGFETTPGIAAAPMGPGIVVAVYSFETHNIETLGSFWGGPMSWLNDSHRLLFERDGKLFVADVRTKSTRELYAIAGERLGMPRLSKDNRTICFTIGHTEGDIWMATLK
jgi:Tol biopolymer transport system component